METLGIVQARGGSKRLPGKNLRRLCGKSLVARAVEDAVSAASVDRVLCTTDSQEIAREARAHGAETPFLRPPELATDDASSLDVDRHAVQWLLDHEGYVPEIVVRLLPTCPLREPADVDACVEVVQEKGGACVSVCEMRDHPYRAMCIDAGGCVVHVFPEDRWRRQSPDFPKRVRPNGGVYAATHDYFTCWGFFGDETRYHEMPVERSVDIDTAEDWARAERVLRRQAWEGLYAGRCAP